MDETSSKEDGVVTAADHWLLVESLGFQLVVHYVASRNSTVNTIRVAVIRIRKIFDYPFGSIFMNFFLVILPAQGLLYLHEMGGI